MYIIIYIYTDHNYSWTSIIFCISVVGPSYSFANNSWERKRLRNFTTWDTIYNMAPSNVDKKALAAWLQTQRTRRQRLLDTCGKLKEQKVCYVKETASCMTRFMHRF